MFHLLRKFSLTKYFPNEENNVEYCYCFLQLVSLIISNQMEHTTLACEFYNEQKN